jgi:hypothetical protein
LGRGFPAGGGDGAAGPLHSTCVTHGSPFSPSRPHPHSRTGGRG